MATQTEISYIESTLPTGVTIAEYRRSRPPRPTLWQRLRPDRLPRLRRAFVWGSVAVEHGFDFVPGGVDPVGRVVRAAVLLARAGPPVVARSRLDGGSVE